MTTVAASIAHMAKLGFVRRTKNGNATSKTVDGMDMENQNRYSADNSVRCPSAPNKVTTVSGNTVNSIPIMILTIVSMTIDCVTLILATTNLPRDRLMEARIPPPIPNISPNPAAIIKIGAAIFTAAMASLPIPRPTNIPSTTVNNADDTIPSNVGKSCFVNNLLTLMFLKSKLSLCISHCF